ncbi:Oxidoreductase, zinc-binding protein [Pseudomonas syringae pv. aptata]|uniref:Oxidoreductase, zinc-binding protein n=1 Tax=Pseudomonas syringae pv. aptata TaxID=83167 RepID=A0A3M5WF94_PSEAP|nr:Oxidoreductase, zinc-binding protein [Pseudomonas syringae pv. aptata]
MKALGLMDNQRLELVDCKDPVMLAPDGVEIDIVLSGICGTDLAVLSGREGGEVGIIRGHEAVGIIIDVGKDVVHLQKGMRVVVDPNEYCGVCEPCRLAKTHLCNGGVNAGLDIAGVNKHGTFAERFVTLERFVYQLPDDMSWAAGVLVEPVACILNNIDQAFIRAGERVLILGSGPMSLIAQIVLRSMGVDTLATDRNTHRIQFGRSQSLDVIHADDLELQMQHQEKFDVVIDTVGNQIDTASRYIGRGGRIVLFGFDSDYHYMLPVKYFLVNAISIISAGEYNQHFPRAIRLVQKLPELGRLVTHRYVLENHSEVFDALLNDASAPNIKSVFTPNLAYL